MKISASSVIQCPFFVKEMRNLLCCEGFVEGTCMTTAFKDRKQAIDYISDNCTRKDGGRCPMAINLFEKYRILQSEEEKAEREWRDKLLLTRGFVRSGDNFTESHTYII